MGDFTNGHWTLPPSATRVISVPIEHRANPRPVQVRVRSTGRKTRRFSHLFHRPARTAL